MAKDTTEQMKQELHRTIDRMRHDLTRVEILTAALNVFSRPIPDYEPTFFHIQHATRGVRELRSSE